MIVNELKKENSGSLKSLDEVGTSEYQFDLESDIETAIIRSELEKEQLEVLQKELNNLTKQQREVLVLLPKCLYVPLSGVLGLLFGCPSSDYCRRYPHCIRCKGCLLYTSRCV